MRVFFDTEFTGLHQNTTLISAGFVAEDNRSFYAEFTDYDRSQVDTWLQANVIDNLTLSDVTEISIPENCYVGDRDFIKPKLMAWLSQFDGIELWSDCLSYDWVLLSELIANRRMGYPVLPDNFSYHSPYDILTLFAINGIDPDINREEFAFGGFPVKGQKHNALWDAKVIKVCYEKLTGDA